MTVALPDPSTLAQNFSDEIWTEEFGNVSSPALIKAWQTLFSIYNDCIEKNESGIQPVRKQVVPMPTGSAKTQATNYYLRQFYELDAFEDIGVLVITYFTDEAIKACGSINKSETCHTANYYSAENRLSDVKLSNTHILYITHAQYLLALQDANRMSRLNTYQGKPRSLVIIDESLGQITDNRVTIQDLTTTINKIEQLQKNKEAPEQDRIPLQDEKQYLESVKELLNDLDSKIFSKSGVYANQSQLQIIKNTNGLLTCLNSYCSGKKEKLIKDVDGTTKTEVLQSLVNTFSAIQTQDICYFSKGELGIYLNSLSWIDIQDQHVVILDATAKTNHVYTLHKNIDLIAIDNSLRRYDNVTLHISEKQYKIGAKSLVKWINEDEKPAKSILDLLDKISPYQEDESLRILEKSLGNIEHDYSTEDKILLVTSSKVEEALKPKLEKHKDDLNTPFHPSLEIEHWGNLTGKNSFKDCNKVFLLGLYNRPDTHTTNLHITSDIGLKAIQHTEQEELSQEIKAERKKIKYSDMAAEAIQAINRIRCRSVTDENGNCAETDVYLFRTSEKNTFSDIVTMIKEAMPGIKVETNPDLALHDDLIYNSQKRTGRPTDKDDNKFIEYVKELLDGDYKTSEIKNNSGIGDTPMKRIWKSVEESETAYDDTKMIHVFCKEHGITISGKGKGKKMTKKTS